MICEIIKDEDFLRNPSADAVPADITVGQNLLDTLRANSDRCVGLAANMIGVLKRIIVVDDNGTYLLMYNPEILKAGGSFTTSEACLSLVGERPTKRFKKIKLKYLNEHFEVRYKTFEGFTAQIIQHEIDHCNGIII